MIRVTLKDGTVVEVPTGTYAHYKQTTEDKMVREVVETNLEVRDGETYYSGKVVASFKADEVMYFEVGEEE